MELLNWKSRASITHTVTANISLTPEDWQIYASRPGAKDTADRLNRAFNDAVNAGKGRPDVYRDVNIVMGELDGFGTTDGEASDVLEALLDIAFPKRS